MFTTSSNKINTYFCYLQMSFSYNYASNIHACNWIPFEHNMAHRYVRMLKTVSVRRINSHGQPTRGGLQALLFGHMVNNPSS